MKFKRMNAVLTLMLLVLGMCMPMAEAVDTKITFGSMTDSSAGGSTTVTVTAQSVPAAKDVTLVAAYVNKETGEILSINSNTQNIAAGGDFLTVTLDDKSAEQNAELRYYLWDSLAGRVTLKNGAPTAPGSASFVSSTINSATLSWTDAKDDYDKVEKYNIYNEGMQVAAGITQKNKTVSGLAWGASYNFEVRAVDDEGAESALGASVAAATKEIPNSVTAGDTITNDADGRLQFFLSTNENYMCSEPVEAQDAGGLACRKTVLTAGGRNTFLNYKFSPAYLATIQNVSDFVLELTYFDEGTQELQIPQMYYYDAKAGKTTAPGISDKLTDGTKLPTKQDSKTWKIARVKFSLPNNSYFVEDTDAGNGYFNFRIKDSSAAGGLKVYRLAIAPKSEYNPVDAYFKAETVNFTCNMDTAAAAQTAAAEKAGRNAVSLSSFTFTVTDKEVQDLTNACVELNYYAENDETICLGSDTYPAKKGEWQKLKLDLGAVGTGSHTISTESGNPIYIHSVRVAAQ